MDKIGIIGFGNMGSSIASQLKKHYQVFVFDKDTSKTRSKDLLAIFYAKNINDLVSLAEVVFLAVKPQDIDAVLKELKNHINGKLVISIAAGITTGHIERMLGKARVIRAMPNIGLKIGESVTCLCKGANAGEEELIFAQELFCYLGSCKIIEEDLMNAATAISGSGPGYIYDFLDTNAIRPDDVPEHLRHDLMKRLEKAAMVVGFSHEDAVFLAANTVNSSIILTQQTKITPAELKKQVASKGGTTEAALEVIHKGGTWEEAAQAALNRAQALARR